MKYLLLFALLFTFIITNAQTRVISRSKLSISHGDITLYLTKDTCTSVSKHTISYSEFLKLDNVRDNQWFQDTFPGKYTKSKYNRSGYDLGHLTPSHITSYDDALNHYSFSLFNQSPQIAAFNRGKWAQIERSVEALIKLHKKSAVIITGVIYNYKSPKFLPNSRIRIPFAYYKIVTVGTITYCWIGSNENGEIISTTILEINQILKHNDMNVYIK
jgi:DNA/RNA endonuclease G (NUC1)